MGVIILGANTSYIIFCLFKQIPMASKGLTVFAQGVLFKGIVVCFVDLLKASKGLTVFAQGVLFKGITFCVVCFVSTQAL